MRISGRISGHRCEFPELSGCRVGISDHFSGSVPISSRFSRATQGEFSDFLALRVGYPECPGLEVTNFRMARPLGMPNDLLVAFFPILGYNDRCEGQPDFS